MDKKISFLLLSFLIMLSSAKVIPTRHDKLSWLQISEVKDKLQSQSKPVIIDLYTNWCYWCKVMDKKTYSNQKVISYINEHFYAVKVNAETRDKITWSNKDFNFNDNYKVNDFTMYVTGGQPGFPTTVIFTDEKSDPVAVQGFLEPKELEPILKYFGEGAYKTQSFTDFKSKFTTTW